MKQLSHKPTEATRALHAALREEGRLALPELPGYTRRYAAFLAAMEAEGVDTAGSVLRLRGLVRWVIFHCNTPQPRFTMNRLMPGKLLDDEWWPGALASAQREGFWKEPKARTEPAKVESRVESRVEVSEEERVLALAELRAKLGRGRP